VQLSRHSRPPQPGPRMTFHTVTHLDQRAYIVLGRQVFSHHVHWVGNRTVPCLDPVAPCPHCGPNVPRRWKGYLHVLMPNLRPDVFLCLPPGAGFHLLADAPRDYDWRGKKLLCHRAGKSSTSALVCAWDPYYQCKTDMAPEKDPGPYLDLLFAPVLSLTR
jgi:hypothetical protein